MAVSRHSHLRTWIVEVRQRSGQTYLRGRIRQTVTRLGYFHKSPMSNLLSDPMFLSSSLLVIHLPLPSPSLPFPWAFAMMLFPFSQTETESRTLKFGLHFSDRELNTGGVGKLGLGQIPFGHVCGRWSFITVEPNPAQEHQEGSRFNKVTTPACLVLTHTHFWFQSPDSAAHELWVPGPPGSDLVCRLTLAGSFLLWKENAKLLGELSKAEAPKEIAGS